MQKCKPLLRNAIATSAARRSNAQDEIAAVEGWADKAKKERTVSWDPMDARQLTLLDQTVRPYLPADYPALPHDPRFGAVTEGTALPPAAHLVYFPSSQDEFQLSPDGYHADEAPPPPFVQRVWAGGVIEFNVANPLKVGEPASLDIAIDDVAIKTKSGADPLVFVKLVREMKNSNGLSVTERRDLAYMKPVTLSRKLVKSKRDPDFSHQLTPSEILLFRYSALTWNSHRIHYDHVYANKTEHHPGLLVHGPLTCTLLLQLLHTHMPKGMALQSFDYRAISPMYCQQPLSLNGRWLSSVASNDPRSGIDGVKLCELWATNNEGGMSMKGTATLVPSTYS
ncbi:hypothetical protein GGI12_004185 [Dipsacomyces acuminosporus]|nr:hypothetical protein GGI12_004185 [Dipsacomyces acuminosporus]